jgi:aminomethyltransferase
VVNAATKEGDFAYIADKLKGAAELKPQHTRALLALQGPLAEAALSVHCPDAAGLSFMQAVRTSVAGKPAIVSRTGYTGEDGFEISLEGGDAEHVGRTLLKDSRVLAIGLGARDSLRLEAGLCLYGHDMDEKTDPVEANLTWSLGKRRKEARDFPGSTRILEHLLNGAGLKRVGLKPEGRAPAREGTEIADGAGRVVGRVTSGGFGPSLNGPLAMGYVNSEFSSIGSKVQLLVRGKAMPAEVVAMPFVPHRYKRPKK